MIGEPQPAIVELVRAGVISGRMLDGGCATGEHTILLTRSGYDVLALSDAGRGLVTEVHTAALGLAVGTRVDEPAWLARVRRT